MYAIHVLPSGTLIIGTEFDGVFRSDDAGASWTLTGESDSGSDSGGSSSSGGTTTINTAHLSIVIKYRGDKGSIKAGKTAKFRVTVTNNGPNVSTDTSVDFFWYRSGLFGSTGYSHTASPGQGSCNNTHDTQLFDCFLGNIPSGGSVNIEFKGQTGNGGTYYLLTRAHNAETTEAVESKNSISAKTELTCILIFCTSKSSGGGATGWWMLGLLGMAAARSHRQRRANRTTA
jgi:MYXO-CTERM domain-containing protein